MKRLDSAAWYIDPGTDRLRLLMEDPPDRTTRRRLRCWGFRPEGPTHSARVWTAKNAEQRRGFLRSL
jgi:hypothetical protein